MSWVGLSVAIVVQYI